jgi:hypothetical protein
LADANSSTFDTPTGSLSTTAALRFFEACGMTPCGQIGTYLFNMTDHALAPANNGYQATLPNHWINIYTPVSALSANVRGTGKNGKVYLPTPTGLGIVDPVNAYISTAVTITGKTTSSIAVRDVSGYGWAIALNSSYGYNSVAVLNDAIIYHNSIEGILHSFNYDGTLKAAKTLAGSFMMGVYISDTTTVNLKINGYGTTRGSVREYNSSLVPVSEKYIDVVNSGWNQFSGVDSSGNVYFGGTYTGSTYKKIYIVKFNSAGVKQWEYSYSSTYSIYLNTMGVMPNGYVVIYFTASTNAVDGTTRKRGVFGIDDNGNYLGASAYAVSAFTEEENGIVVTSKNCENLKDESGYLTFFKMSNQGTGPGAQIMSYYSGGGSFGNAGLSLGCGTAMSFIGATTSETVNNQPAGAIYVLYTINNVVYLQRYRNYYGGTASEISWTRRIELPAKTFMLTTTHRGGGAVIAGFVVFALQDTDGKNYLIKYPTDGSLLGPLGPFVISDGLNYGPETTGYPTLTNAPITITQGAVASPITLTSIATTALTSATPSLEVIEA